MLRENKFTLPFELVPSYNRILRMNRWDLGRIKQAVYDEMLSQYNGKHRMQRCTVEFCGYLCKYRDWDGFLTGLKYPLDFLVIKGFIPDDSPDYVTLLSPRQYKVRKKKDQRFEIIIREVV